MTSEPGCYSAPVRYLAPVDSIVFLDTPRARFDRGWYADDVLRALRDAGIRSSLVTVSTTEELLRVTATSSGSLFWPLDYRLSGRCEGPWLVEQVEACGAPYLTTNPQSVRYTSKLQFKEALQKAGLGTPEYEVLTDRDLAPRETSYPCYLKTEYTCDSAGVRRAENADDAARHVAELRSRFTDDVFAEAENAGPEFTIACIRTPDGIVTAALAMRARLAPYVDEYAKHHNGALLLSSADPATSAELSEYAGMVTDALDLTGYYRIDVRRGSSIEAIDLNLLPLLNGPDEELSYFPMALMRATGCGYEDVLRWVLRSAELQGRSLERNGPLETFINATGPRRDEE